MLNIYVCNVFIMLFIFRENLTEPSHNRYCKIVLTNSFLVIILFFLTTPVIVLNVMDTLKLREIEKAVS